MEGGGGKGEGEEGGVGFRARLRRRYQEEVGMPLSSTGGGELEVEGGWGTFGEVF